MLNCTWRTIRIQTLHPCWLCDSMSQASDFTKTWDGAKLCRGRKSCSMKNPIHFANLFSAILALDPLHLHTIPMTAWELLLESSEALSQRNSVATMHQSSCQLLNQGLLFAGHKRNKTTSCKSWQCPASRVGFASGYCSDRNSDMCGYKTYG